MAARDFNNIIYDNTSPVGPQLAVESSGYFSVVSVKHNNIAGGESDVYVSPEAILNWGFGNIDADSLFIGSDPYDYHFQPLSPCIDAGTDENAPETDFEGNHRPEGDL